MQEFLAIIRGYSAGYEGPHLDYILNFESLYVLVNQLVRRQLLAPEDRLLALAAIGYVSVLDNAVAVHDVGAEGYLDDCYLLCLVLRHLRRKLDEEDLYQHWRGPGKLTELLGKSFEALRDHLGERAVKTREFVGLPAGVQG